MKTKLTCVRVLCAKQKASDVLSVLLEENFIPDSTITVAGGFEFKRFEGENPYETSLAHLRSVAKYAGWTYEKPE